MGRWSRRSLSNKRRSHIAIAIKFDNVSRAIMDDGTKESARILQHIQSFCCKAVAVSSRFLLRPSWLLNAQNNKFFIRSDFVEKPTMENARRKQLPSVTIERLTRNDLKRLLGRSEPVDLRFK